MSFYIRTAACCIGAVLLSTAADAQGIRVMSAIYGTPQTGQVCDASAAIAAKCAGQRQCIVDIRNVNLCGDPNFLVVKQIDIEYRCGRAVYKTTASEYYLSNLACQ